MNLDSLIRAALEEDIGTGDITSLAIDAHNQQAHAYCIAKETACIAGLEVIQKVYQISDSSVYFTKHTYDGALIDKGFKVFEVYGNAYTLLTTERLVLNLLQRLSGIATQTYHVVRQLEGTACKVLDTRKTTPLWRALEKWAVQVGGGTNHRAGLFDAYLLKDNHIDLVGDIEKAIQKVIEHKKMNQNTAPIIVEVRNMKEVAAALRYTEFLDHLLLDNFTVEEVERAVAFIEGRLPVEVSGGITVENARAYALAGADYLSSGSLTHSVKAVDLSLKIVT
ncbi:MAG: carboxylating nicotinate-nucleotide diphosphorylase [Bacteroidia bacterium]